MSPEQKSQKLLYPVSLVTFLLSKCTKTEQGDAYMVAAPTTPNLPVLSVVS